MDMEIKDFLNKNGRTISAKTKEEYVKKHSHSDYIKILELSNKLRINERSFSEKIYHFINKSEFLIVCKNCGSKATKYRGLVNGYLDYCSSVCSNSSKDVMKKKEKSYLEKYGVTNPSHSEEIINKIKDTFIKKYGGNPVKNEKIKEKIRSTSLKKYNDTHPFGANSTLRKEYNIKIENEFREKYKDLNILVYNTAKNSTCIIECDVCKNNYEISKWNLHQRYIRHDNSLNSLCTICNPIGSSVITAMESFIGNLLESKKIEYKRDRKIINPYEIDFLIEEKKIGIETNGIYWHSSKFKDKGYHLNKTERCLEKNISLIHIFEDEFVLKKNIVESRILSILGYHDKKIYARKCIIKEINSIDANNFLDNNHLQGRSGATIRLGLFLNDQMVSLMTFGKERRSLGSKHKEGSWELIRFCNKINHVVIGGASKLLKYFIKNSNPDKITSFCDRRWSPNTDFYSNLGFNFIHNTDPNYWYYKNNTYEKSHRYNYRKDVLVKKGHDLNKTELEIMDGLGYLRVYDCGSSKWEWVKS
jgi:hypothetical protein